MLSTPQARCLKSDFAAERSAPEQSDSLVVVLVDAGESATEVRQSLEQTFQKQTLVQFTYRDPATALQDAKLVTPVSLRSEEVTGFEEGGKFQIVVTEV